MKKFFKLFAVVALIVAFSSCQRFWESTRRSLQTSDRNYHITQYSGGKFIGEYKFKGILNNAENSDGYYWYQDGVLYEVSGDLIIKSWK